MQQYEINMQKQYAKICNKIRKIMICRSPYFAYFAYAYAHTTFLMLAQS